MSDEQYERKEAARLLRCTCPRNFKFHANNCPIQPGEYQEEWARKADTENQALQEALEQTSQIQPRVLAMLRREGFKFETPLDQSEGWEKLAFTLYSTICEVDSIARNALSPTQETDPAERLLDRWYGELSWALERKVQGKPNDHLPELLADISEALSPTQETDPE